MKVIMISEERLDELVDTMLLKLRDGKEPERSPDDVNITQRLNYREVHYYAHELKKKIKDEAL